jgi:hypothetical protein
MILISSRVRRGSFGMILQQAVEQLVGFHGDAR